KCSQVVKRDILQMLTHDFTEELHPTFHKDEWDLRVSPSEGDPVLLFAYPQGLDAHGADYIRPEVRLEFGARGDPWPEVKTSVTSYAAEDVPQSFRAPSTPVRALAPERTFWEKATILHAHYHLPPDRV